jgi:hypothetical protein
MTRWPMNIDEDGYYSGTPQDENPYRRKREETLEEMKKRYERENFIDEDHDYNEQR